MDTPDHMIPNNPAEVLLALDRELDHQVSLVLYGRAALCLGFENPPPDLQATLDVDAIIPLSQLPHLMEDFSFWDALDRANLSLQSKGLYLTHLFSEEQVFLRPNWERHIVPIVHPKTRFLRLFRPHVIDLILTKMMRGNDELDMADIRFLVARGNVSPSQVEQAITEVRMPEITELRDAFERAIPTVRAIASKNQA
jgi:hypothetical protein